VSQNTLESHCETTTKIPRFMFISVLRWNNYGFSKCVRGQQGPTFI